VTAAQTPQDVGVATPTQDGATLATVFAGAEAGSRSGAGSGAGDEARRDERRNAGD